MANQHGVLGLQILETILAARYGGVENASVTKELPHDEVPGTQTEAHEAILGDPHFDELLSFCACMHLAQFINEKEAACAEAADLLERAEEYKNLDKVKEQATEFRQKRNDAYTALSDPLSQDLSALKD